MKKYITALAALVAGAAASPVERRDDVTAVVDLSVSRGAPQNLASGWIYGIPDTENQVPDHWYTDVKFRYGRAGGAQLGAPSRGWIWGHAEYYNRFLSTLSNYHTCRKYGARFSMLPHDIWGTDNTNSSTIWPGDNGQWGDYDLFVRTLINDMVAHNMIDGVDWEIWNEPDISVFWKGKGGMQQWVDLYIRTHKLVRADSRMNKVKIAGPSLAFRPKASNAYWMAWLKQIAGNNTIPDQYAYHLEGGRTEVDNDPTYTNASLAQMLNMFGLPQREVNINEYAQFAEQVPTADAWWIAALERFDFLGMRGNWQSSTVLHDLFANLLTKTDDPYNYASTKYTAGPGWYVYRYYGTNMTGNGAHRVKTTRTGNGWLDVYATVSNDRVRLLVGTKITPGTYTVRVDKMSAVSLPTSGSVSIDTWGFDGTNVFTPQAPPSFRNTVSHAYSGDSLSFPIYQTDAHTAWAFEFNVGPGYHT